MHWLGYILPEVAKLSRALQMQHLHVHLFMISSLVNVTLCPLDNAMVTSANWVLELRVGIQEFVTATVEGIIGLD